MGSGGSNALWSSRNSVAGALALAGYVPANGYVIAQVQCANKLSVRVVFTVTAIWPCLHLSRHVANCLGVIWSSLTGN